MCIIYIYIFFISNFFKDRPVNDNRSLSVHMHLCIYSHRTCLKWWLNRWYNRVYNTKQVGWFLLVQNGLFLWLKSIRSFWKKLHIYSIIKSSHLYNYLYHDKLNNIFVFICWFSLECKIDLAMVVDASGSIYGDGTGTEANWVAIKNFLEAIVSSFVIGPDQAQVGLVKFASE